MNNYYAIGLNGFPHYDIIQSHSKWNKIKILKYMYQMYCLQK